MRLRGRYWHGPALQAGIFLKSGSCGRSGLSPSAPDGRATRTKANSVQASVPTSTARIGRAASGDRSHLGLRAAGLGASRATDEGAHGQAGCHGAGCKRFGDHAVSMPHRVGNVNQADCNRCTRMARASSACYPRSPVALLCGGTAAHRHAQTPQPVRPTFQAWPNPASASTASGITSTGKASAERA